MNRTRVVLLAVCAALALASCQSPTGYQRSSLWNDGYGYTDNALGADEHSVTVRGNALTSSARAAQLALLRAAHLSLEHGRARFVVVDQESRLRKQDQFRNEAVPGAGGMLIVPVEHRTTREPVAVLLIRLLSDDAPPTTGEVHARALIVELESALERSPATAP